MRAGPDAVVLPLQETHGGERPEVAEHTLRLAYGDRIVEQKQPRKGGRGLRESPGVPGAHRRPQGVVEPLAHAGELGHEGLVETRRVERLAQSQEDALGHPHETFDVKSLHGRRTIHRVVRGEDAQVAPSPSRGLTP